LYHAHMGRKTKHWQGFKGMGGMGYWHGRPNEPTKSLASEIIKSTHFPGKRGQKRIEGGWPIKKEKEVKKGKGKGENAKESQRSGGSLRPRKQKPKRKGVQKLQSLGAQINQLLGIPSKTSFDRRLQTATGKGNGVHPRRRKDGGGAPGKTTASAGGSKEGKRGPREKKTQSGGTTR